MSDVNIIGKVEFGKQDMPSVSNPPIINWPKTVTKLANDLTALREENTKLKEDKRELVEALETGLNRISDTILYYTIINYPEQPVITLGDLFKAAVAKHREW